MAGANGSGRRFGATLGTGTTDAVQTAYKGAGSNKRSYFIWYFIRTGAGGNNGRQFSKGPTGTGSESLLTVSTAISAAVGRAYFVRHDGSNNVTAQHACNGNSFTTNIWHNIVVTHDQSAGLTAPSFFLDGVSQTAISSAAAGGQASNNTDPFIIGNGIAGTRNWDGSLAHFAIWDNVLLSAGEALSLHNGFLPWQIRPESLVCYVPMFGDSPEMDLVLGNAGATVTGALPAIGPPVSRIFRERPYTHTTGSR
jgi:hypothetical protein